MQLDLPMKVQAVGEKLHTRATFDEVYNSQGCYDPKSTEHQRTRALKFLRSHPNQKFSVDEVIEFITPPNTKKRPSQTSLSSSLRDLRKPQYGGFNVPSGYDTDGIFKYWFVPEEVVHA